MVMAVANAAVPKFTVVIGGSFGAGNYAMCGRAYGPRQLWLWPNSRTSVMGGEQAANVLLTVGSISFGQRGETMTPEEQAAFKAPTLERVRARGQPVLQHGAPLGRRRHRPGRYARGAGARDLGGAECADPADDVRGVPDVSAP